MTHRSRTTAAGRAGWDASHTELARGLAVFLVIPNAALWLASAGLGIARPLINVDYLLLGFVAAVAPRIAVAIGFIALLLLDAAISLGPAFNFEPPAAMAALGQFRHLDAVTLVLIAAAVAVVTVIVFLLSPRVAPGMSARRILIAHALLIPAMLVADSLNGLGYFGRRERMVLPVNIATSRLYSGQRAIRQARASGSSDHVARQVSAATDSLRRVIQTDGADLPERVVLVLVESLGAFSDPAVGSALLGRLETPAIRQRFDSRSGVVASEGATTEAEFRELCGVLRSYRTPPREMAGDCLPAALARMGYETVAMHGYNSRLFGRRDWYPLLGFTRTSFHDELLLERPGLEECGIAFRGVCDSAFLPLLAAELRRMPEQRLFLYWLTLSTHFPLDPRSGSGSPSCSELGLDGDRSLCLYMRGLWIVFDVVARLAEDASVPPAWYVIVGDHPPPVMAARGGVFQSNEVSYVELVPKFR